MDIFKGYFKITDGTTDCTTAVEVTIHSDQGKTETVPITYQDAEKALTIYGQHFGGYRDGWQVNKIGLPVSVLKYRWPAALLAASEKAL